MLGEPVAVITQLVRMLRPGTHVDEGLRGVAPLSDGSQIENREWDQWSCLWLQLKPYHVDQ